MAPYVERVAAWALQKCQPKRAWVFGSHARGEARESSDVDIAFDVDPNAREWLRLIASVEEEAPTLHGVDLVNINDCDPALREKIFAEGKLIYGKEAT